MAFGEKLREAREKKGLSQSDLARLMGIDSTNAISRWEKNTYRPDLDKLRQLCQLLSVSADSLLELERNNHSHSSLNLELSDQEETLVTQLRSLDTLGYERVVHDINFEAKRCRETETVPHRSTPATPREPLFLKKSDKNFNAMKIRAEELRAINKTVGRSAESITRFLWAAGYGDVICIADIALFLRGFKVPSLEIYDHIRAFLTHTYDLDVPRTKPID